MFEEIVTEEEIKFNNLEKKIFKFVCKFWMFNNKINFRKLWQKDNESQRYEEI